MEKGRPLRSGPDGYARSSSGTVSAGSTSARGLRIAMSVSGSRGRKSSLTLNPSPSAWLHAAPMAHQYFCLPSLVTA